MQATFGWGLPLVKCPPLFCLLSLVWLALIKSTLKGQADKSCLARKQNQKKSPNLSVSLKQIWRSLCCVLVRPEEMPTWKVPALAHGWYSQCTLVLYLLEKPCLPCPTPQEAASWIREITEKQKQALRRDPRRLDQTRAQTSEPDGHHRAPQDLSKAFGSHRTVSRIPGNPSGKAKVLERYTAL